MRRRWWVLVVAVFVVQTATVRVVYGSWWMEPLDHLCSLVLALVAWEWRGRRWWFEAVEAVKEEARA